MTPARPKSGRRSPKRAAKSGADETDVAAALAWLERHASPKVRAGMARYAIPAENAWGIAVGELRLAGKHGPAAMEAAASWAQPDCRRELSEHGSHGTKIVPMALADSETFSLY